MTFRLSVLARAAVLAAALALGCGGANSTVTGKVMHKGAPAVGAVVIFHPKGGKPTDARPTGSVGDDGSFTMETITKPGVAPGTYAVTIKWEGRAAAVKAAGMGGGEERAASNDRLGDRYANPEAPKFEVTIKPGQNTLDPFNVE